MQLEVADHRIDEVDLGVGGVLALGERREPVAAGRCFTPVKL
jgi:hypothetical protein